VPDNLCIGVSSLDVHYEDSKQHNLTCLRCLVRGKVIHKNTSFNINVYQPSIAILSVAVLCVYM
jgi:hypothetical protein